MSDKWTPDEFWQYVGGLASEWGAGQMRDMMTERGLTLTPSRPVTAGREAPRDLRLIDWVYLYATEGGGWPDQKSVADPLIELAARRGPTQEDADLLAFGGTLKELLALPSDPASTLPPPQGPVTAGAVPVGYLHEIIEPPSDHSKMFSSSSENPWGHWLENYKATCTYKCTPLYAAPPAAAGREEISLKALMKIAHYSPASTVQPVAIAREALIEAIGTWQQGALSTLSPQDGGPVTTEQLDVLQFGRPLHERPCRMFTDNSTPAEMAEFLRSCGSDTGDQIAKMLERPAPGAERAADYLKKLHRNLIGWLAARYVTSLEAAQTVASDCDKHIDKSGRLLGEVREAVYALPRAVRGAE